uniref:Uncharacterized protein n=1 Tax=Sphaerodactylus townsendi TaxID=933632 RepID=A0ACB8GA82_9SAUR
MAEVSSQKSSCLSHASYDKCPLKHGQCDINNQGLCSLRLKKLTVLRELDKELSSVLIAVKIQMIDALNPGGAGIAVE